VRHRRLESWTPSQERRGLCQAPDTTSASRAQQVEDGTSSLFARKHTARKLEGLPFRAAIGDRQAVYWWLLGHELSFQAKSLGSRPRSSNRLIASSLCVPSQCRFDARGLDASKAFVCLTVCICSVCLHMCMCMCMCMMRVKVRKAGGGQWGAGADSLARGRGGMLVGGAAQEAAQLVLRGELSTVYAVDAGRR
jgi:hypothetical protein